jgi:hypothetical protein
MPFEEIDKEDSGNSLNDVSSLDNDFAKMQFKPSSSEKKVTHDDVDLQVCDKIESKSDVEFQGNHGIVEGVTPALEVDTINPIDSYRHFVTTDEIISFIVRETNRYAEQHLQTQGLSRRSKALQWEPTTKEAREASLATAKKIKTFCSDCDKSFCLDCFNKKHHPMQYCILPFDVRYSSQGLLGSFL